MNDRRHLAGAPLSVIWAAVWIVSGCTLSPGGVLPTRPAEVTIDPSPTLPREIDRTPLFTDPPLPTYFKTPRPTPERSPWTMPECVDWTWQLDEMRGLEALATLSSLIVVGTFDGYGSGRWNTSDGSRPTAQQFRESPYEITIVRDVEIDVDTEVRLDALGLSGSYVKGGVSGCDSIQYSHMPEISPGTRAVFFLNPWPIGGAASPVLPELLRVWPIDDAGLITTEDSGQMTVPEFEDAVSLIPYQPTTVLPGLVDISGASARRVGDGASI